MYAIEMMCPHPFEVLVLLGSIVPCATGAKALDVDTDHLGIQPVRIG